MRIVSFSYAAIKEFTDPEAWLQHIRFSSCVLENMIQYGEVMSIYHIQPKAQLFKNKVTYLFSGYNRWQLLLPFQFTKYIVTLRPEVVIVHGLHSPWQIIWLHRKLGSGVKIIVQHHAERPPGDLRRYIHQWADYFIDAYLFCAKDLASEWVASGQIKDPEKIREVMEVSSIFYPIERSLAKSKLEILGKTIFLWIGRLIPNKDPLEVVYAFTRFAKLNPGAKLYMIYQSNELLDEIESLVKSTSSYNSITLVGPVNHDELLYWYNSVDFMISSSHYEGSGTAVCEAMSCGCIPILSSIPSFRMMTDNGRVGLLFDKSNEDSLFKALQKSVTLNLVEEHENVLKQFAKKLSPQAIARDIYNVIVSL